MEKLIQKKKYIIYNQDYEFLVFCPTNDSQILVPSFMENGKYFDVSLKILSELDMDYDNVEHLTTVLREKERLICINGKLKKATVPSLEKLYFSYYKNLNKGDLFKLNMALSEENIYFELLSYNQIEKRVCNNCQIDTDLLSVLKEMAQLKSNKQYLKKA